MKYLTFSVSVPPASADWFRLLVGRKETDSLILSSDSEIF